MATEEASDPINIAEPPCNIAEQIPDPVPEQTSVEDQEPNPDSVSTEVGIAEQTLDTVSRGQDQPNITPQDQTVVPTSDEISAEPSVIMRWKLGKNKAIPEEKRRKQQREQSMKEKIIQS